METCYCAFCHEACGEREYCDEVCQQEHDDELRDWQQTPDEDYPD